MSEKKPQPICQALEAFCAAMKEAGHDLEFIALGETGFEAFQKEVDGHDDRFLFKSKVGMRVMIVADVD